MKFLEDNVLATFGCLANIMTDNAQDFKSAKFITFCKKYNIIVGHFSTYYPQGNGLAES